MSVEAALMVAISHCIVLLAGTCIAILAGFEAAPEAHCRMCDHKGSVAGLEPMPRWSTPYDNASSCIFASWQAFKLMPFLQSRFVASGTLIFVIAGRLTFYRVVLQ